jgi:hypothetical protein
MQNTECKMQKQICLSMLVLLLCTGCANGVYSGTLIFEGDHTFGAETRLPGDVVLRAGRAEFAPGAQVAGSVYVLGGTLVMHGLVGGDLAALDGRVELGPTTVINGDLRIGGGTTRGVESATLHGAVVSGMALPLESTPRSAGWEATARWFGGALLLAVFGGLWAQRRPEPLQNIAAAATADWPAAAALGLLAVLVLPILLVMMAFTIVLIPLVVVIGLALFLILGMGIVALGRLVGQGLARLRTGGLAPGWATFYGTLALMGLYALPVVGGFLLGLTAILLCGAVVLSRFGTRPFSPAMAYEVEPPEAYRRAENRAIEEQRNRGTEEQRNRIQKSEV